MCNIKTERGIVVQQDGTVLLYRRDAAGGESEG